MITQKLFLLINDKNKRNFFIYGLGQAFNLLSPLIIAPYIVSICNEEGFGKVGMGFALALFLILIVDYAFDVKGTKEVSENRHDQVALQKIINTAIFSKITLFGIASIIAYFLIGFIPFFSQEKTLFFFSLIIVLAQVFNPIWFLQGIEQFVLASMLNIGSKVTYVVLVFWFVNFKNDYILVNLFLGCSSFLFNIIGLVIIKTKFNFKIAFPGFPEIKNIIQTDFYFCVSQLFLSIRQLCPLVLTGYFLGFYVAGQYKIMEQIITLFRTFIQVFLKFFYPSVCYKIKNNIKEGYAFWKKYTLLNFSAVFVVLLVIFIFSEEVLEFFNLSAGTLKQINPIFRTSLVISLLMAISLPLEQLMFITNISKIYVRIAISVAIINVCLILLMINSLHLYGIIISLIVSEIFFIILYFRNSYVHLKDKIKE